MASRSLSSLRDRTLELAGRHIDRHAGPGLTPAAAKLYSQQVRLRANQPGLSGWRQQEADERLEEAVRLLDAALIELEEGGEPSRSWAGLRRAAELLEWLSHPDICPRGVPVRLLAAAAYQLAGYPARSSGLLLAGSRLRVKGPQAPLADRLHIADRCGRPFLE